MFVKRFFAFAPRIGARGQKVDYFAAVLPKHFAEVLPDFAETFCRHFGHILPTFCRSHNLRKLGLFSYLCLIVTVIYATGFCRSFAETFCRGKFERQTLVMVMVMVMVLVI